MRRLRSLATLVLTGLTLCAAVAELSACIPAEVTPGGGFVVRAPPRMLQGATSDNAALCALLAVDVTFDRTDDLGPAELDRVALVAKDGVACTWVLEGEHELLGGTYDLVVRFLATGDYAGAETCGADEDVWVGAYVRRDINFPDDLSALGEDEFLSRPGDEAALGIDGVSFDPDDDGRDTLAEIAQGADPCKPSSVPSVSVSPLSTSVVEGEPIVWTVSSSDEDQVPHHVTFTVTQNFGADVGTESIVFRARTDAPAEAVIIPDDVRRPALETWRFRVLSAVSTNPGEATWQLELTPDEPFIGDLSVSWSADDGQGNELDPGGAGTADVANVIDPTRLVFFDGADEAPQTQVDFREVGPGTDATVLRFRFDNQDLLADASAWTAQLDADAPVGMALAAPSASPYWTLTWAPDNATTLTWPLAGAPMTLRLFDGDALEQASETLTVDIAPLFNNEPWFTAPAAGDLQLSAATFVTKEVRFEVHDPDEVGTAPSCTLNIEPVAGTPCTAPFVVTCGPEGERQGELWNFLAEIVPAADYFTTCGDRPEFTLEVVITDVPPMGSDPATPWVVNEPSCAPGELHCQPLMAFATADVVTWADVAAGAGITVPTNSHDEWAVDGTILTAIGQVDDGAGFDGLAIVDLRAPAPVFVHTLDPAVLCSFENDLQDPTFVVDEIGHRVIARGREANAGSCFSGERYVALIDLEPPYDVVRHLYADVCPDCSSSDCIGNPVVDATGTAHLVCAPDSPDPAQVVTFDAAGNMTRKDLPGVDETWFQNKTNAVVEGSDGKQWLVVLDWLGVLAVDLGATADPIIPVRLAMAGVDPFETEAFAVDPLRHAYMFALDDEDTPEPPAYLYRVRFDPTPTADAPLDLGHVGGSDNNGDVFMRILVRESARMGEPAVAAPHLLIAGGATEDLPWVDLDTWSLMGDSNLEIACRGLCGSCGEIYTAPDRRYLMTTATYCDSDSDKDGLVLFDWTTDTPDPIFVRAPIVQYMPDDQEDIITSESGDLVLFPDNDHLAVFYFGDAASGVD